MFCLCVHVCASVCTSVHVCECRCVCECRLGWDSLYPLLTLFLGPCRPTEAPPSADEQETVQRALTFLS